MRWAYSFKYSRELRYVLFFVTAFLVIATVKVYVNNINIDNSILDNVKQQKYYKEREAFENNFYLKYLSWDQSLFFFSHENNVIFSWENIVKFTDLEKNKSNSMFWFQTWVEDTTTGSYSLSWTLVEQIMSKEKIINITMPQDSWKYFLYKKYEALKIVLDN